MRATTAAVCILLCAFAAPAQAEGPDDGAPCPPLNLNGNIDWDCIEGWIHHDETANELLVSDDREWCDPVAIGVQPNVDWGCISRMIHG